MGIKPKRVRKTNGEIFRALLNENGITLTEAAAMMKKADRTVERWIADPDTTNYRKMSDDALEIFRIRLERRANG